MNAMAFVPAPNVAQVEVRGIYDGQHIENRFFVDFLTPVTEELLSSLANDVWGWVVSDYVAVLTDQTTITEVVATDMSSDSGPQVTIAPGPIDGTVAGGTLPANATLCYSLRSSARGRSARGRWYWLTLPATQVSVNTVGLTYAGNCLDALNALHDTIETAGWKWVIVSYIHNGGPRPGGPVYFVVSNITFVDRTVDSQRRRLPGRGT